jgi:hypothetical protein
MSPLGAVANAARRIPASSPTPAAGRGRGKGFQPPRARFRGSVSPGRRPASGAPAAGGGGRREPSCGAAGAQLRDDEARVVVLGVSGRGYSRVVLGGGRLGEELSGAVQEGAAARSASPRQGTAPYMGTTASSCAPATTEAVARS